MEALQIEVPEELSVILQDSGLELTETEQIKQSYLPFFIDLSKIKEDAQKINFENPTELDEKIARELRLRTVKVRTGSELVKDDRKKIYTLKGNLEQSAWNLLRDGCKLDEERFAQVEKAREIKAAAERAALKTLRIEELSPVAEFVPMGIDLGNMKDEDYQKLKAGAFAQAEAKKAADLKAEADRIAAEKAKAKEDARIRAENEKLQAEKIKAEAMAKKEREELEKKLAAEKAKADAAKKLADEQLAKEREAREKLEREAKTKADAEAKAKREADEKVAADEKARVAAEKKAAKAPDKVKMKAWLDTITIRPLPAESLSDESLHIANEIFEKLGAFKLWAEKKIEEI